MTTLTMAEFYLGRYTSAYEHGQMALRMTVPMQNMRMLGNAHNILAEILLVTGRFDAAFEHTVQVLEFSSAKVHPRVYTQALRIQGDAYCSLMNWDAAEACYRQALADQPPNYATLNASQSLGWLLSQTGRAQEGLSILEDALQVCESGGMHLHRLDLLHARGWALLELGQFDEAGKIAYQVAAEASERELPWPLALAYLLLAELASKNGRTDEALQKLLAVIRMTRDLNCVMLELPALLRAIQLVDPSNHDHQALKDRSVLLLTELEKNTRRPELQNVFPISPKNLQFRN